MALAGIPIGYFEYTGRTLAIDLLKVLGSPCFEVSELLLLFLKIRGPSD